MDKVGDVAPTILGAIAILIIGWLIAKLIRYLVKKGLKTIRIDELSDKVGLTQILNQFNIKVKLSAFLAGFCYWLVILLFIISASESLGFTVVSNEIGKLVSYFPQLLSALIILVVGVVAANMIKKAVLSATNSIGISGAKVIGNIVFYVLLIFIVITSLNQAGIDTSLITSNVVIIMGAVLLAFSIAYGFAARDILTNMLSSFYGKDRFRQGQTIKINDITGEVIKIDSIAITLLTDDDRKIIIPCKKLVSEEVEILKDIEE